MTDNIGTLFLENSNLVTSVVHLVTRCLAVWNGIVRNRHCVSMFWNRDMSVFLHTKHTVSRFSRVIPSAFGATFAQLNFQEENDSQCSMHRRKQTDTSPAWVLTWRENMQKECNSKVHSCSSHMFCCVLFLPVVLLPIRILGLSFFNVIKMRSWNLV